MSAASSSEREAERAGHARVLKATVAATAAPPPLNLTPSKRNTARRHAGLPRARRADGAVGRPSPEDFSWHTPATRECCAMLPS